ncbi:DNA-binding protein [Grosmannia clavigera kw1407]|uniref:DNA-binding protein n=1 Tax=Grosmannia clavigera (strain kw1407 / UAMH 11150) TaxID=655863 RepID=F0XUT7_GROCL|nr:DNA-binding protein [Grosmannia clavigera kw1407]EFW98846.1 DNA-binding protein [Grosmannia clavigera kw1407]
MPTELEEKIAEHVITILINLSGDPEVLNNLASDQKFLDLIFACVTNEAEPNANLMAMLLANLAKSDDLKGILERTQKPSEKLSSDDRVINQLMDLFVKGFDGSFNKNADYDYLAYFFADMAKHAEVRQHLVTKQPYDNVVPITKITVFTNHKSDVRRKGVASMLKNVAFDVPSHPAFLSDDEINLLPYLLLPLAGNETYDEDEMLDMLPDLQFLPPDKQRDPDSSILQTHVETLTLLTTTREGRDLMRRIQVYPLIRETHLRVDDEDLREACDRLVNVLMRDEADTGAVPLAEEEDEDERIVEV